MFLTDQNMILEALVLELLIVLGFSIIEFFRTVFHYILQLGLHVFSCQWWVSFLHQQVCSVYYNVHEGTSAWHATHSYIVAFEIAPAI